MLGQEGFVDIQVLHRQGVSIKGIARELGVSRNTVRKYLRADQAPEFKACRSRPSKLDPFKDYLQQRVAAAPAHAGAGTLPWRGAPPATAPAVPPPRPP